MESVRDRIKRLITEQFGFQPGDIKEESTLKEDLGADSLDCVEFTMAVEEEFEIEIPDEDAEKLLTVQQVIDYVETKLKK